LRSATGRRALQRNRVCAEPSPVATSTLVAETLVAESNRRHEHGECGRLYRAERVSAALQRRADLDGLPLQRAAPGADVAGVSPVLTQMWQG
jgi:hypothetical protein